MIKNEESINAMVEFLWEHIDKYKDTIITEDDYREILYKDLLEFTGLEE